MKQAQQQYYTYQQQQKAQQPAAATTTTTTSAEAETNTKEINPLNKKAFKNMDKWAQRTKEIHQALEAEQQAANTAAKIDKGFVPNLQYQRALQQIAEIEHQKEVQQQKRHAQKRKFDELLAQHKRDEAEQAAEEEAADIGSKLLKGMGWKEGEGLGKNKTGIVEPISVQKRDKQAGIGFGNSYDVSDPSLMPQPGDSYSESVRKKARLRYHALKE